MNRWQHLSSSYVHENPFYKVRRDEVIRPDGKKGRYHVIESGRAAIIIPVTEDNKILFVRMFRYPTQMESWEVPAGGVEEGEDALEAAKRELLEETGYTADTWNYLGAIQDSASKMDQMDDVFICHGLQKQGGDSRLEEGITNVQSFAMKEVVEMISSGQITDATTIAPLLLAIASKKLSLT